MAVVDANLVDKLPSGGFNIHLPRAVSLRLSPVVPSLLPRPGGYCTGF